MSETNNNNRITFDDPIRQSYASSLSIPQLIRNHYYDEYTAYVDNLRDERYERRISGENRIITHLEQERRDRHLRVRLILDTLFGDGEPIREYVTENDSLIVNDYHLFETIFDIVKGQHPTWSSRQLYLETYERYTNAIYGRDYARENRLNRQNDLSLENINFTEEQDDEYNGHPDAELLRVIRNVLNANHINEWTEDRIREETFLEYERMDENEINALYEKMYKGENYDAIQEHYNIINCNELSKLTYQVSVEEYERKKNETRSSLEENSTIYACYCCGDCRHKLYDCDNQIINDLRNKFLDEYVLNNTLPIIEMDLSTLQLPKLKVIAYSLNILLVENSINNIENGYSYIENIVNVCLKYKNRKKNVKNMVGNNIIFSNINDIYLIELTEEEKKEKYVEKDYECPICYEVTSNKKYLTTKECSHTFCKKCACIHFNNNNSCPMCRSNVFGMYIQ